MKWKNKGKKKKKQRQQKDETVEAELKAELLESVAVVMGCLQEVALTP